MPEHFDLTSIGATEDVVVPATNISAPGRDETMVAVNSLSEHSAIVPPPTRSERCGPRRGPTATVRRHRHRGAGAVAPVVISRVSHEFGDGAAAILGGAG